MGIIRRIAFAFMILFAPASMLGEIMANLINDPDMRKMAAKVKAKDSHVD